MLSGEAAVSYAGTLVHPAHHPAHPAEELALPSYSLGAVVMKLPKKPAHKPPVKLAKDEGKPALAQVSACLRVRPLLPTAPYTHPVFYVIL